MAVKGRMLSVRLDHQGACLRFGEQVLESDALRRQLTLLATQLLKVRGANFSSFASWALLILIKS